MSQYHYQNYSKFASFLKVFENIWIEVCTHPVIVRKILYLETFLSLSIVFWMTFLESNRYAAILFPHLSKFFIYSKNKRFYIFFQNQYAMIMNILLLFLFPKINYAQGFIAWLRVTSLLSTPTAHKAKLILKTNNE